MFSHANKEPLALANNGWVDISRLNCLHLDQAKEGHCKGNKNVFWMLLCITL